MNNISDPDLTGLDPDRYAYAEHLRTMADRLECGELHSFAFVATQGVGGVVSFHWTPEDDETDGLLRLLGGVSMLQARVLHAYGVPEAQNIMIIEDDE
jgi:hypothetical protein